MKILIGGSHGMIGSVLTHHLQDRGYDVHRLVRQTPGPGEVWWDPDGGKIEAAGLEGFDGVIHLATMPWPSRWTPSVKQSLTANRLGTTRLLTESLARCDNRPKVFISASGMGYYSSSGDAVLTEASPAGGTFLAKLQCDAELATKPASLGGIRVVNPRIPAVLGGDMLKRAGFRAGSGKQWMSWVSRDELVSIIEFALTHESLGGPVNAVSPNSVRNAEFSKTAIRVLGRKSGGYIPAILVRMMFGEMGEELILASRRIQPTKLLAAGYQFQYADLEQALRHEADKAGASLQAQGKRSSTRKSASSSLVSRAFSSHSSNDGR